jgi:polyisoprenyl-phosphate glycosyltransferase
MQPYLSVVAPCYNEEESLPEFYRRTAAVCSALDRPYEIILVNDGSRDRTWHIMQDLSRRDPRLVCINLTRNHGHQLALTAGLSMCRGERILVIDADLQDPPELLPQMLRMMDGGVDVVYGQRRRRAGESAFKKLSAAAFYRVLGKLTTVPIPPDTGDFRLMTRRVLQTLQTMPERHRFIRGMVSWIGHRQQALLYDRDPRFAGETKYPLRTMWKLAVDGVTSFSIKPLQWAGWLGLIVCVAGMGLLAAALIAWLHNAAGSGWLALLAGMALLGGAQLVGLGILGEYVGRLCEQSRGRPMYLIDRIECSAGERLELPDTYAEQPGAPVAA